ncbi:hypothetical protein [Paenibacillus sp. Marseille-Q4541]|uniref:hypothetical protein n=1 Tax=Paenibacillus sp. Marseille-Q4541 TaxID=2831522 RepID=UPI001BAB4BF9|nr:hypothetical protein [Paenibacillus sp. Marseille-Q4541]
MRERHEHKRMHGRREHLEQRSKDSEDGIRDLSDQHHKKAQTFRRGRAITFLDKLYVNRATLQRQLQESTFDSIKDVLRGELKATETIIEEFIHVFQLHEVGSEDNKSNNA